MKTVKEVSILTGISVRTMHQIVIAHRLSTIQACDRIIALDKGRIVESGTFEELSARGGFFAELVKRQQIADTQTDISHIRGLER